MGFSHEWEVARFIYRGRERQSKILPTAFHLRIIAQKRPIIAGRVSYDVVYILGFIASTPVF